MFIIKYTDRINKANGMIKKFMSLAYFSSAVLVSLVSSSASCSLLSQSSSDFSAASVICSLVSWELLIFCLKP